MKSCVELPEGYEEILSIDLQKDKKLALLVNGLAILIAVPLAVIGLLIVPVSVLFDMSAGFGRYCLRFAALLVGVIVYMVLHELVHGIFMKRFSGVKPRYGFPGLYAYAGSDAYFGKRHYIIIALAPVVVWGLVLLLLNAVVSPEWFWVVYFIQIGNLSGAAGDLYVTYKFRQLPEDILVRDTGVAMTVYSKGN